MFPRDVESAAAIVALLTIAMVLCIQAFDSLAVLGGGAPILALDSLFAGIANPETRLEPEYWWVYALLLTTLVPSLINLGIGGASLMRGLPGVSTLLLRHLHVDKEVRFYDRPVIAFFLAFQNVFGVILGIAVQALIFWAVIGHVMPSLGLGLLDLARDLVALDLPDRAWHLLGLDSLSSKRLSDACHQSGIQQFRWFRSGEYPPAAVTESWEHGSRVLASA